MSKLKTLSKKIVSEIINEIQPDEGVKKTLRSLKLKGNCITLIAIGKAAWTMALASYDVLGDKIQQGVVITKTNYSQGDIANLEIYEAGHPLPDERSLFATRRVLEICGNLTSEDVVLFLVSGGGSSLFESLKDGVKLSDIVEVNAQLLKSGASIKEVNAIRKRLSCVKGGQFAKKCNPAHIVSLICSDVLGDDVSQVASGPCVRDVTTRKEIQQIIEKYKLKLNKRQLCAMDSELPQDISNVENYLTGSVVQLCQKTAKVVEHFGFTPVLLTSNMNGFAKVEGEKLGKLARASKNGETNYKTPCAMILGGETVVKVTGNGLGGRNQEFAIAACKEIQGLKGVLIFSFGSDGTDGPTDAAGGMVEGDTFDQLKKRGIVINDVLENNDAYHALKAVDALFMTGATGCNVNDVAVLLIL